MARSLWLILGMAAADLLLDWLFRMDIGQRAVLLAIMLLVVMWASYRWIVQPLVTTVSNDALALRVEAANPRLGQALITALQLSRLGDGAPKGASPLLVRQAINSGIKVAEEISFGNILESRRFLRNCFLLAAAICCWLVVAAAAPFASPVRIWFSRNILLSRATWPQKTYLTIERLNSNRIVVFPRGADWTQVVSVSPNSIVIPDAIYLDVRNVGNRQSRPSLVMQRIDERQFEAAFTSVNEPFEFRARGGDAVTEWVRVELDDPPAFRELKIIVAPPSYTGQLPEELVPGQSSYQVLHGSSLRILAIPNKPLATAALVHGDTRWPLSSDDSTRSSRLVADVSSTELRDGPYLIQLVDQLGLAANAAEFGLRWQIDHPPDVKAKLNGTGQIILPQAQVPFACEASDDYGLTSLNAVLRWNQNGSDDELQKHSVSLSKPDEFGEPGKPTSNRQWSSAGAIDLEALKLPPGTNLMLKFESTDNNNVTGPSTGRSTEFFLRIVTPEEFRGDLLRREMLQRQELEQLWKSQDDLLTDSRALAAATNSTSFAGDERQTQLYRIFRSQKTIGQRIGSLADRIVGLADEVRNSRLPDEGQRLHNRLAHEIAEPLRATTAEILELVHTLDRSRQVVIAGNKPDFTDIITQQSDIVAQMKRVLDHMTSSENYQEVIDLLHEIQKAQTDVHKQTIQAREERIRRILEGSGQLP